MCLGVFDDGHDLVGIGGVVHIDVAVAVEVLDDWYPGIARNPFDQSLAAARYDHIDVFGHGDQLTYRGAISRLDDLDSGGRQARGFQPSAHAGGDRLVAVQGFLAAAQDGGVAGLEAQRRRVGRDIGARLVNDADDAQRHAHLADLDAARAALDVGHLAHRVGQGGDLLEARGHRLDAGGAEGQTVDHRRLEAVRAGLREVARVGGEKALAARADLCGDGGECGVLGLGRGGGHGTGGFAGLPSDGLHVTSDIHGSTQGKRANLLLKHPYCNAQTISLGRGRVV